MTDTVWEIVSVLDERTDLPIAQQSSSSMQFLESLKIASILVNFLAFPVR